MLRNMPHTGKAGRKWRPGNGTSGEIFMAEFCWQCAQYPDCHIIDATYVYNVDDEEYPEEWQIAKDGYPTCTSFKRPLFKQRHDCTVVNWNRQEDDTWTCRDCGAVIPDDVMEEYK